MPDEFYIALTEEKVCIPPECCATLDDYDNTWGRIQVHSAGFFNPGFGWPSGTQAILEIKVRDAPVCIRTGRKIAALRYEKMSSIPENIYKGGYQKQKLTPGKYFTELSEC